MVDLRSVELFAGTGGLALGMHLAGVKAHTVIEWDANLIQSFDANKARLGSPTILHDDVRTVSFDSLPPVDLVTGGPPCQPFSNGGKHFGNKDVRDMFPEAVRAVRELSPQGFIFENVQGLMRPAFKKYVDEKILAQLRRPGNGIKYDVVAGILNAADFGVPQKRKRTFFVGIDAAHGLSASLPSPTHSGLALEKAKADGTYWRDHGMKPSSGGKQVAAGELRWRTTRDALSGLPDPQSLAGRAITNHEFRGGARSYPGHDGSELDQPAKTIKAGVHGVPGGENTVRLDDGSIRYFTVRESARVQTFPDWYRFYGSWSTAMKQIGNAVPPLLAQAVGQHVIGLFEGRQTQLKLALA